MASFGKAPATGDILTEMDNISGEEQFQPDPSRMKPSFILLRKLDSDGTAATPVRDTFTAATSTLPHRQDIETRLVVDQVKIAKRRLALTNRQVTGAYAAIKGTGSELRKALNKGMQPLTVRKLHCLGWLEKKPPVNPGTKAEQPERPTEAVTTTAQAQATQDRAVAGMVAQFTKETETK